MIKEEPEPKPQPKPKAKQKAKPQAKPKPKPKAEAKPKAKPKAKSKSEKKPVAAPEPKVGKPVPEADKTVIRPIPEELRDDAKPAQATPGEAMDEGSAFLADIMEDLEEDLYAVRETAEKRLRDMESSQIVNTERIMTHLSEEHLAAEALNENAGKHFEMGIAYLETGLYEDAITDFQIASNDPIFYQRACLKLGICFLSKGMDEVAITWLQKGITGGGDVEIMADSLHQLAIIYQIQGEMEAFKHAVEQLESLAPDHPGLETLKAVL